VTAVPTRATADGAAYLDLQNKARKDKRPTDELLALYTLEGFLARLTTSAYASQLLLKGGVLIAAYAARRPTRDVDLQAQDLSNDANQVLEIVRTIATIAADDGLVFDADGASAEVIRDNDEYTGVRVSMKAQLATAKITFHVDVNVGDPITPERWTAWRRRQKREGDLPASFAEVLELVAAFADPVLSGAVTTGEWDPAALAWI
jgi:hypothetical protein